MASLSRSAVLGRSVRALALTFVVVVLGAVSVRAGGAVFEFDRPWFAPGELATGRVEFTEVERTGTVEDGPYTAYLLAEPGGWLEPGSISPSAIPLGAVEISDPRSTWGDGVATISFVVPDIASGGYTIQICSAGCETSLGDITFGWIEVYHTPLEASLAKRLERAGERVDAVRRLLRRETGRNEALEARAGRSDVAVRTIARELAAADARADALERRLASVTRPSRPSEADPRTAWPVLVAVAAFVALLAFAATRRPRRRDSRTLLGTNPILENLRGKRAWPKDPRSRTNATTRPRVSRSSHVPTSTATASPRKRGSDPTA